MSQNFDKRISICVRRDLPEWQVLNTVAHIAAYFGNFLKEDFSTGDYFITADNLKIPRDSQYGIVVLQANKDDLNPLITCAHRENVDWMGFTKEMVEYSDDNQIQEAHQQQNGKDIEYFGVGLFGNKQKLQDITKHLKLWK